MRSERFDFWSNPVTADRSSQRASVSFRFDTFGDEQVWTDKLRLNEVVEKNVDPTTDLVEYLKSL